jgi:hypothetical protein
MRLTEIQAWEFVREAFLDKNLVQCLSGVYVRYPDSEDRFFAYGMCDVILHLLGDRRISTKVEKSMIDKIEAALDEKFAKRQKADSSFLFNDTRYGARKRREFCTKMIKDLTDKK